jgi:hypothetical protein
MLSFACFSQKNAVILENLWMNELNNYTPKEFFDKFYISLKEKLAVKQVAEDPNSLKVGRRTDDWSQKIREKIKAKNLKPDSLYFIALSTDLRLPTVNLGKFLFKNPPRSSKLVFIMHVFDASANQVLADTIVNRGCVVKSLEEGKGSKFFYSSYDSFITDMQCHLEVIRKRLQQLVIPKRREYMVI